MRGTHRITTLAAGLAILAACSSSTGPTSSDRNACAALRQVFTGPSSTTHQEGRAIVTAGRRAHDHSIRTAADDLERNANADDQPGVTTALEHMTAACSRLHLTP